ncbi:GNAT family N-acetyltransferase [bacterium]|nr:GNAT family N-acetyltransferase [bacterium]
MHDPRRAEEDLKPPRTILETARLSLREWSLDDVDRFAEIYADPEVMRFVGNYRPRTREETIERKLKSIRHYEAHGFGMWAVIDKESGALIGRAGLEYLDNDVEIAWLLARDWWGRGLATEAARAVLGYGFGVLGLDRIVAAAIPENSASINVMRKLGMRQCGSRMAAGREMIVFEVFREEVLELRAISGFPSPPTQGPP